MKQSEQGKVVNHAALIAERWNSKSLDTPPQEPGDEDELKTAMEGGMEEWKSLKLVTGAFPPLAEKAVQKFSGGTSAILLYSGHMPVNDSLTGDVVWLVKRQGDSEECMIRATNKNGPGNEHLFLRKFADGTFAKLVCGPSEGMPNGMIKYARGLRYEEGMKFCCLLKDVRSKRALYDPLYYILRNGALEPISEDEYNDTD